MKPVRAPDYKLFVENADVTSYLRSRIKSVSFEDDIEEAAMVTIQFDNKDNFISDHSLFLEGNMVKLYGGYFNIEEANHKLFEGKIISLEPSWDGGGAQVTCRAYDLRTELDKGAHTKIWKYERLSSLIKAVVRGAKSSFIKTTADSIEITPRMFYSFSQEDETEWEFIKRYANDHGYLLWFDENSIVHFQSRANMNAKELAAKFRFGSDLSSCSLRLKTLKIPNTVLTVLVFLTIDVIIIRK